MRLQRGYHFSDKLVMDILQHSELRFGKPFLEIALVCRAFTRPPITIEPLRDSRRTGCVRGTRHPKREAIPNAAT